MVEARRPAARRNHPGNEAAGRRRRRGTGGGGGGAAAAPVAADVCTGADDEAAGEREGLAAADHRAAVGLFHHRHVCAAPDRSPWLAAGASRRCDRRNGRPKARTRRHGARHRQRPVAGNRPGNDDLSRPARRSDGIAVGRRSRSAAAACGICRRAGGDDLRRLSDLRFLRQSPRGLRRAVAGLAQ